MRPTRTQLDPPPPLPGAWTLIRGAIHSARRQPFAAFLGWPMTAALAVGGCLVPLVNFPFILIALAPTVGSLPRIALDVARGERVSIAAPLVGFRRYERFLGLFWVPYLIAAGASAPLLVALWIDRRLAHGEAGLGLFLVAGLLTATILGAVLHRYVLAPFAAADLDRTLPLAAVLERAAALLDGRRARVLGRLGAIALFGLSGAAVFGAGLLLTAPLAAIAAAHLYLRLSAEANAPAAALPRELSSIRAQPTLADQLPRSPDSKPSAKISGP